MPPLAHMPPTKVSITARTQAKQARQDGKDCKQMDLALLHGVCKLSAARSSKRKRLHALCSPAKLVKPELAMGDRHKGAARCIIQPYKRNEIAAQAMLKRRRAAEHSATKKRRRELPSSLDPAASVRNFSPSLSRFHPQRAFSFQAPRDPCRDMTNAPAWWQTPDHPGPESPTSEAEGHCTLANADAAVFDCAQTHLHELRKAPSPVNQLSDPEAIPVCSEGDVMASAGDLISLNKGQSLESSASPGFAFLAHASKMPVPHSLHWPPFVGYPSSHHTLSSAEKLLQESCEGLLELSNMQPSDAQPFQSSSRPLHELELDSHSHSMENETRLDTCKDQLHCSMEPVQDNAGDQTSSVSGLDRCSSLGQEAHDDWCLGQSPLAHAAADPNLFGLSPETQKSIRSLQDEGSEQDESGSGTDWETWLTECLAEKGSPLEAALLSST
ncbi:hypothetical protein WJX74_006427 [Apatococcus lobatus]|uniref:Uncharacterized protein n=1 Tax=Apatococcus lobatus TaxID=904363 RepID=A0AAW1RE07_9CHLO